MRPLTSPEVLALKGYLIHNLSVHVGGGGGGGGSNLCNQPSSIESCKPIISGLLLLLSPILHDDSTNQ